MKLDNLRQVETPEGLALGLRLAGVLPRGSALALDLVIRGLFYILVFGFLEWMGVMGDALLMLILFVTEWFYFVFFEVQFNGVTPGKHWIGLRVLHDDGTPVGWSASLVRNFMRAVDFLPFCYGFGIMSSTLSPSFRRLGDWAAGTVVVHDPSAKAKLRARRKRQAALKRGNAPVTLVPPPLVMDREEQGALLAFLQRRNRWSLERAEELSDILEPITGQVGRDGLERTLGYGAWLEDEA